MHFTFLVIRNADLNKVGQSSTYIDKLPRIEMYEHLSLISQHLFILTNKIWDK